MSGVDPERKRKRKRKTRAERNQMSRHHLLEQEKQKKLTKNLKDIEPCHNTIYTLRSGRGSSHSSFLPKDDRKEKSGAITQGRLTRSLGKLTFTNAKSSEWIKRGPISETETMKKKVESDIKRILRLAEKSTLTNNEDFCTANLPECSNTSLEVTKTTEPEPEVMEVYCPSHSSVSVEKNVPEGSYQRETTIPTSATVTITSATVQGQVTPSKSGNSFAWTSARPNNADETLELEPPVQEIADKILRELKPKFARMFPNRDIEMEICSDLQKVLNHSFCHSEDLQAGSAVNTFLPHEYNDPMNLCNPALGTPASTNSTLSVCRPSRRSQTRQLYSHLQHIEEIRSEPNGSVLIQDSTPYPCVSTYGSTAFHKDCVQPSFTATFVMPDLPEIEDVMKMSVNVDDSEDDDDNDVLSTARYNAFLASSRELELEQERLLQRINTYEGMAPSHLSSYHQCNDKHHLLRQPCGLKDESTSHASRDPVSCSRPFDWRNVCAARVLDFSKPSGGHQLEAVSFSCPSRHITESLCSNIHPCHSVLGQSNSQFDYLIKNASDQQQCVFVNQRCSLDSMDSYSLDKQWACAESYSSPVSNFVKRNTANNASSCLVQSRLNFQNALKFACGPNDVNQSKSAELMDTDGCDDFLSGIHHKSSPLQACHFLGPRHLMAKPLSELQGHQADLQRQARNFIDDLNRCGAKPRQDFINCQATSQTRHLFQMGSPDSNGSPVWGMLPVMKDFGLETGGFA